MNSVLPAVIVPLFRYVGVSAVTCWTVRGFVTFGIVLEMVAARRR